MNRKFALLLVLSGAVNVAVGQTFVTTGTLHEDRFAHTATLLSDGTVLVVGGTTFFGPTATAEMYHPDTGEWSYASGKLNTARTGHAAVRLDDGKVLIIGGSDQASNPLSSVELFDPETETFRLMASLPNSLSSGQAFNVGNDKVVFIQRNGQGSGVAIFDYSSNSWKPGATVPTGGQSPAMIMLANGNIFVCGGWDEASDVEIYNPSGDSWTSLAPMAQGRTSPIATALSNGNVFIASGFAEGTDGAYALSSTEIYNPNSSPNGASVLGPTLPQPGPMGSGLVNALMPSGKVLITGGGYSPSYGAVDVPLAQAAIYDPTLNIITTIGPMNVSRQNHTVIALTNGNVLLVGGITGQGYGRVTSAGITAVCELFGDALTPQQPGQFVSTGTLATALTGQQATTLSNGTVLLTGGGAGQDSATTATAQIYNPASASFRYTKDNMTTPRIGHTSSLLPDGRVLIAGGSNGNPDPGGCLSSTEIYDPVADTFTAAAPMNYCRHAHQAVILSDGRIMVISGYAETSSQIVTNTVEIFDPNTAAWTVVAPLPSGRASFAATRLLEGNVLISGGYWATDADGLQAVYVYNPTTNIWTSMAPMLAPRENHIAITLPTGKVLMVGGNDGTAAIGFSELYDTSAKSSGNSTVAGGISAGGWAANAVLLPDGNVWSAGGYSQLLAYYSSGYEVCSAGLPTAQVYNYLTNSWTDFSSMQISRFNASASLLPSGQVLVAGGFEQTCPNGGQTVLSEAELWQESTGTGTIDASTNLASATFTITGPATYNGNGMSFTQTNAPVGTYTITYGSVAKYITPASQTGTLTAAQTLTFSEGQYVPITLKACATASSSTCVQSLSFSYPEGFVGPPKPQDVALSSNAGAISLTVAPSSTPSGWLTASVSSGTTAATVAVSVSLGSLTPGTYKGNVVFASTSATNTQTIEVTLTVTPTITITSIGGWTAGSAGNYIVHNAQWQGQPSDARNHGKYYLFYAIDSYAGINSFWQIHGSGFGAKQGTIAFSDASISSVSATSSSVSKWTDTEITFTPSFVPSVSFRYTANPNLTTLQTSGVSITITTASGATLTKALPRPSGLPSGTAWKGGVMGTIKDRGYGQCTWYVALERLLASLTIPLQSAYSITDYIDANYVPQQWDVVDFGTRLSASRITGAHTAIIVSPVKTSQVSNPNGSTTVTYSFTIGEMNVKPAWGEQESSVSSKFVITISPTGTNAITKQIYSDYSPTAYAIAYFR